MTARELTSATARTSSSPGRRKGPNHPVLPTVPPATAISPFRNQYSPATRAVSPPPISYPTSTVTVADAGVVASLMMLNSTAYSSVASVPGLKAIDSTVVTGKGST